MMVEELLELFVTEVDADLFKRIEFEDLKTSDVEDADEVDLWGKFDVSRLFHVFLLFMV